MHNGRAFSSALSPFSLSPLDLDPWCEASPFVIASNLP
jgi:hypothetical protein